MIFDFEITGTKLINGLKAEIEALKAQLLGGTAAASGGTNNGTMNENKSEWEKEREELMAKLKESETLALQAAMTWYVLRKQKNYEQ